MTTFKEPTPIGGRFGKLTVVGDGVHGILPNGRTKRMVKVRCDCGVVCDKVLSYVKHGSTTTCGTCPKVTNLIDLKGYVFGELTVESYSGKTEKGHMWHCLCSCGESIEYDSATLNRSNTHNCGRCASSTQSNAVYLKDLSVMDNGVGDIATAIGFNENPDKKRLTVRYQDGTIGYTTLYYFRKGMFTNHNRPRVQGVGFMGYGEYKSKVGGHHTRAYSAWRSMLLRCYSGRYPSYEGVTVATEWHNFQNFAKWAAEQVGYDKKGWELDKDLLRAGNKTYSEDSCCFLPQEINAFIKTKSLNDLPLGVDTTEAADGTIKYRAQGAEQNKVVGLGVYGSPEQAHVAYKEHKEALAGLLAIRYSKVLAKRAVEALQHYTVKEVNCNDTTGI